MGGEGSLCGLLAPSDGLAMDLAYLYVHFCPFLSIFVHFCPFLSIFVQGSKIRFDRYYLIDTYDEKLEFRSML